MTEVKDFIDGDLAGRQPALQKTQEVKHVREELFRICLDFLVDFDCAEAEGVDFGESWQGFIESGALFRLNVNGGGIDASCTRKPSSFPFITSFGILGALALPILRLLLLDYFPLCDCIRVEVGLGKTG